MDQQTYLPVEMQFYLSVMFLGFPDKIHEEKPSFLDFENNWLRTDGPTDRRTDGRTDGRTDPLIEVLVRTYCALRLFKEMSQNACEKGAKTRSRRERKYKQEKKKHARTS